MGGGGDGEGEGVSELRSGDGVTINIRSSNGAKFSVLIDLDSTVESFKTVVAGKCDVAAGQQRLIYNGRILKDDQTLRSYGLEADHTIHLVCGFAQASSTNPSAAALEANLGHSNSTQGHAREASSNEGGELGGSGYGASLFSGLGMGAFSRTGGLFGVGLPELEQVQQQLSQNPNIMRDIMNMPVVQNLMNNPDIMRNMIINNPQIREIMDRNPELAHVLNDPSTLRQTIEAARNPELMREVMRNTDRAMSNIEATPEGFNMLRRMYETVQEPFLNATTMGANTGNDGTQGGNQTRDGSTSPSTTGSETPAGSTVPNTNPLPNPWTSAGTGGAQTNTTRSNAMGDSRQRAPAGLGGIGLPDPSSIIQLMQNPAISQMMQSVFSNPQYMNQILGLNPQLHSMLDSNPQLRENFQNPELLRQMTSPETMQQLLTMQQSLVSLLGQQQSSREPGQNGGGTGAVNNAGLEMLMNMFGGLGAGSLAVPTRSNVPPEELYATQLTQLQEMGFFDTQENLRALIATAGNVHAAVERLLSNSGL